MGERKIQDFQHVNCRLHLEQTYFPVKLSSVSEVFSRREGCSIFGGNCCSGEDRRFSIWAAEPVDVFEFNEGQKEPFEKLKSVLGKYKLTDGDFKGLAKGFFCCGWIGYFGYGLNQYIENIGEANIDDTGLGHVRLCFYDRAVCYDHTEGVWRLVVLEMTGDNESVQEKTSSLLDILKEAEGIEVCVPARGDVVGIDSDVFSCNMSRAYYFEAFGKIQKYIYDGDVYQINFSRRFECEYRGRGIELYHWQNEYNPSPYAAFIDGGDNFIVSASPEMFITIHDGYIYTKPIKGTRARINGGDSEKINRVNFSELVGSEKEQAELNMIVDLERNDIARICRAGTRKVLQARTIEEYATVFHAVATISGELAQWQGIEDFCEVLKAVFPGGSITGAPKIRAMEIIEELEPTGRGVYTGSVGYIGLDGSVCLNIAIRTIIIKDGRAYVQTGGGIVADSKAEAEWEETITKAKALLAGINSVQRTEDSMKRAARAD